MISVVSSGVSARYFADVINVGLRETIFEKFANVRVLNCVPEKFLFFFERQGLFVRWMLKEAGDIEGLGS